jgi:chlorobactene glucosyltransferase
MLVLISGAIWAGLVVYLLARAVRQFRNYRQSSIPPADGSRVLPAISIIVPVRNEVANIDLCLAGLSAQTCLSAGSSIIVVDDGSQDGTRAAAERHASIDPRIELIDAGPLPAGWAGKPHACWRGASLAGGGWLCFVDADVRVAPGLVAAAITAAEARGADMLSLHPLQELGSFWERLVIPAGLMVLACAKRFEPASHDVVNGQFLLIRRAAYVQVGGHSAVRAEICEDKALAARIRESGFALQVLAAENLAQTRMYRDLRSLWEGFSKNATDALDGVGVTLVAAGAAFAFGWAGLLLPLAALLVAFADPSPATGAGGALAVVGTGIVVGVHLGTARHFRIPAVFGLTFALGYTAVACLACSAVLMQLRGRVRWKGRTYQLTKSSPGRA